MTDTLTTAMEWILKTESDSHFVFPHDRGCESKFGLSKKNYPDIDIAYLTIEGAMEIYRKDYWDKYRCGELNQVAGILLFDAVIKHNKSSTGTRLLQDTVGCAPDGIIGSVTIANVNRRDDRQLMFNFIRNRAVYYHYSVTADSSLAKYLPDWCCRLSKLQQFINDVGLLRR